MAAALTIGQNLKQTQPNVYGKSPGTPKRSPSIKQAHTSSLLKRNSSFHGSTAPTAIPQQSRTNSNVSRRHSVTPSSVIQEYHIDDSFTDASFDQMGVDADNHYSNAARVSDLKLHHVPPPKTQQKMVKKYIPTPNGIKIVEVPSDSIKSDIARSNSMRLGMSLSRSGLLQNGPRANSLTAPRKQPLRKPGLRLSSISSQPRIDENVALESHQHPAGSPRGHEDELQHQIEHERQLAKDLEGQREKFLKLKELRLKNERRMKELQVLQEEEALHLEGSRGTPGDSQMTSLEPELGKSSDFTQPEEPASPKSIENGISRSAVSAPAKPLGAAVVADDDDEEEDVPVAPVPFVVDEMELKQLKEAHKSPVISENLADSDLISHSSSKDSFNKTSITTSPQDAVVNNYGDTMISFEEKNTADSPDTLGDFGIEEIPKEYFDFPDLPASGNEGEIAKPVTLAPPASDAALDESPSPSFDPVPEIIGDLVPPTNIAGSIRSFSSTDSKSRPIKSAMKNPKSNLKPAGGVAESPANKAYLSLTTAENTRLNSKLSSSQLQEFHAQQELKAQTSKSQLSAPQAPQFQPLRKQPSVNTQGSGFSGRSLRPQSMADSPASRSPQGGGMSSRSFKTQSIVQPIPQHNFHQSSSKLRAAELYAKANKRPTSEFRPLQRKSSFTRERPENATAAPPTRRTHRTTLRAAPAHLVQSNGINEKARPDFRSNDGQYPGTDALATRPSETATDSKKQVRNTGGAGQGGGFKSRFADSDDEQNTTGYTGFSSRFGDSDDEGSQTYASSAAPVAEMPLHKTMRLSQPLSQKKESTKKEKKPKKKFLKKLFGKD